MRDLDDLILPGAKVLVRVDLNVPMRDGQVSNKNRINRKKAEVTAKGAFRVPERLVCVEEQLG